MNFTQVKDIQADGKNVMIIFRKNPPLSGLNYFWRKKPEYPYLTFALCRKTTMVGDEIHVSGTHIDEGITFCAGFTDKNKLLVPLNPDTSTHLDWNSIHNRHIEIYSSKTATPAIADGSDGKIIIGEYYSNNGTKYSHEYTFRAYGVKNEADHINFYNRANEVLGGLATFMSGKGTYQDFEEWEISDAEWSISDTGTQQIKVYGSNTLDGNPVSYYVSYNPEECIFQKGSLVYWPTSYYEVRDATYSIQTVSVGNPPLITLDGKKGATKIISIRDNFTMYKAYHSSSIPYIKAFVKIDCKSKSLGINETWGMYAGVTVKN